jgi:hypothetical protein
VPLEGSSERVGMVTTDRAFQILAEADSPGVVRARVFTVLWQCKRALVRK